MLARYTIEQIDFLRKAYPYLTASSLARAFNAIFGDNKTEDQIRSTLTRSGIRTGHTPKLFAKRLRLYTPEQAQFLRENYAGRNIAELKTIFNDKFETSMTGQQIKTFVHNRGITCGRTSCYAKGHTPWNAGTKGQGLTGANSGSFKKGSVPPNRRRLGSHRIDSKDGYILIKVAETDPHTGVPTRYKCKHVHVWEQHNGPVPEGHVVVFRNGIKQDTYIENLECISRAENMKRNTIHNLPKELADVCRLRGVLNRHINKGVKK